MPKAQYRLDVEGFLTAFGGAQRIQAAAEKAKIPVVGYKGMRQWVRRGTMPLTRFLELMVLANVSGIDMDVNDFIVPANQD